MIDLTNWYLTLPVGNPGSPTLIKQPQLATYSLDPWFVRMGESLRFRAHCGGVTTSGSSYPRCELREMKGTSNAKWSTTSGKHTMIIRQAVTHAPVVKPQVVCGQIHGGSDDICVFMYDGASKSIKWKKGDTLQSLKLIPDYVLGTMFEAKFVATAGRIELWVNGSKKASFSKSSSTCFYKAGDYTQSNVSKGDSADAYGEVLIERLEVTHA